MVRQRAMCRKAWYPVALSSELGREPTRVDLLGDPYVLYRSLSGDPVVHLDRCPHRNVPLSGGTCHQDDTLVCPYHGWRFAPDGACTQIPGSTSPPKASHRVETYVTCEKYGFVWMCPATDGGRPEAPPLEVPEARDDAYARMSRKVEFPGGMHAVIENALDVPHTAVLHRGLFRSGEDGRDVDVVVRRHRTWVEAEFIGESPPGGLIARLLTMGSKGALNDLKLQHWDRFILPGVLQVEYRIGPRSHFLITGFCSPQDATKTRLFALVCLKTPLPRFIERLLMRVIEPFAMKIVAQDVAVLEAQTDTLEHFGGERFMSTDIDVLGSSITRLLKEASDREAAGALSDAGHGELDRSQEPRDVTKLKILV